MGNINIHRDLVDKLKHGSSDAFSELYAIYSGLLYGFVLKLTKSHAETKDITQETFLKLWQGRGSISLDLSFKSYLFRIAQNMVVDAVRHETSKASFEAYVKGQEVKISSENAVENAVYYNDLVEKLEKAKDKMTIRQKEIYELNREQGCSTTAIAEKLNISNKTVQNTLSAALSILRSELASYSPTIIVIVILFA